MSSSGRIVGRRETVIVFKVLVVLSLICGPMLAGSSVAAQSAAVALPGVDSGGLPESRFARYARPSPGPGDPLLPVERSRGAVGQVAVQVAAGIAAAWVGGLLSYAIASGIANDQVVKGDDSYSPAGNWAYIFGSTLNAAAVVHAVGSRGQGGRYWITAAGAALPSLLLVARADEPTLPTFGVVVAAPLQAGGATIAFRLMRR